MGNAINKSPNPRDCIIPIVLFIIFNLLQRGLCVYIHCELLASITCDLFHPAITLTLLIYMALIEEHCEEAYEEALK